MVRELLDKCIASRYTIYWQKVILSRLTDDSGQARATVWGDVTHPASPLL